jgi:hypothetical protein
MRSRGTIAIGIVAIWLRAGAAQGQDSSAEAQARFNEGVQAYQRGDYEHARVLFLQSEALVARGSTLRNLALAEMGVGRKVEALHHFREALTHPDLDPGRRAITESDIREAYAATGHIAVETHEGARVNIDGGSVEGRAPFKEFFDVLPGTHVVEAALGGDASRVNVQALAGAVVTAKLPFAPLVTELPTAPVPTAVAPAVVPRARPESPVREESSFWSPRRGIGVGTASLGVVVIGVGAFVYADGDSAKDKANSDLAGLSRSACTGATRPAACADASSAWSKQNTDASWSRTLFAVGAVGVVAGAALVLWPQRSPSMVAIAPLATPHGGGLRLQGEF